jgi:DNA repair protein RadD
MQLRPYQTEDLERVRARLRAGVRRVLLQQPTGAGKTILSGTMLKGASERGLRSWFAVHRKELLDQTSEKLRLLGVDHGFIAAGYPTNASRRSSCARSTRSGVVSKSATRRT